MKILFVHQNFPGQFVHLAPALAQRGHEVMGLGDAANKRPAPVRTLYYRSPEKRGVKGLGSTFVEVATRGEMVAGACSQMEEKAGFVPDVIVGHNGWGETLFLREIWPNVRMVDYAEFAYRARGLDSDFDPEFQSISLKAGIATAARAAHILQSMIQADAAMAPTAWQKATFPALLQDKITVVHDGVDTDAVRPDAAATFTLPDGRVLRKGDEVISFVNRNLEPYRGYHIFMRALPEVLAARPAAQVIMVGGEQQSYGRPPEAGTTWKQKFLDEVKDRLDLSRVHFTGKIPRAQFVALMQVTRVHAYLTYPFVLSWSMIEAMSAGALVIGSRTGPVEEVIEDGVNGRLVDFFDVPGWSKALIRALEKPEADEDLRRAARKTAIDRYDLNRCCLPRQIAVIEALANG